jgi:hypothetical protein
MVLPIPPVSKSELRRRKQAFARQLKALLVANKQQASVSWLLAGFARLHAELRALLLDSGLYSQTEMGRLLAALDYLIDRQVEQLVREASAAQVAAWLRSIDDIDKLTLTFELSYIKGLTGLEERLIVEFLTANLIKGITEEMRAAIRAEIVNGLLMRLNPFQVMARISNILGIRDLRGFRELGTTGISAKAERIMRTEIMTILNAGTDYRMSQAKKQFPDLQDIWIATGDDRTRDTHLAEHGAARGADGLFRPGGFPARFPLDPGLPAKERINCRCRVIPYRADWGPLSDLIGPLADKIDIERQRRARQTVAKAARRKVK